MSYAPPTLVALAKYWTDQGGVNLGIVGDTGHTTGYHLGRDRIYDGTGPGQGDDDYSVKHPRDKAGLSGAAAAIDLGKLGGTYAGLYKFNRWLVEQCQARAPGSGDVREVIYSPDGVKVQRYSGIDGGIHEGPGNGDASHKTHTHISYFRDAEQRDKVGLFAPYFKGDDMAAVVWYPTGSAVGTVQLNAGRGLVDLITGKRYVPKDTLKVTQGTAHAEGIGDGYLVRDAGHGCLALKDAVTFTPKLPGPSGPEVLTGDDGSEYRRSV